ncbi:MAG: DnaA regulatory inactivator Hda [Burkholderiaceae bacterium]
MKQVALDLGVMPRPSFKNFYAGPNQDIVKVLSDWVSRLDAHVHSMPFYIWGEHGSGKTHLLQAVMKEALHAGRKGIYFNPQEGLVVQALDFDPRWQFMVVDDVHLLSPPYEAVVFNWFVNALSPSDGLHRAILIAGDRPAADLVLREDLRTRIGGGLVYGLKVMSENERREVLSQQASLRGLALPEEVLDFMLTRFSRDLSNLVGWLEQLDRYALETQRPITIPLIKDMLKDI